MLSLRTSLFGSKAFTFMEALICIIILASFLSLSILNYVFSLEKTKAVEGIQILRRLLELQMTYHLENNAYTNALGDLSITIPTPVHFLDPTISTNITQLATIQRTGSYILTIDENSTISCFQGAGAANTCTKLGY